MPKDRSEAARIAEYQLRRKVDALKAQLYSRAEPDKETALQAELAAAQAALRQQQTDLRQAEAARSQEDKTGLLLDTAGATARPGGALMGADTTRIDAQVQLRMSHVPCGIVHLLDRQQMPLVTFKVKYTGSKFVRLRLTSSVEGYSAEAVDSIELTPKQREVEIQQLPTFFPDSIQYLTELTRATLRIQIDDLEDVDGRSEQQSSFPIWLLARNNAPLYLLDPTTGQWRDVSHYLGAWVTPNVPDVMHVLRRAAELHPQRVIVGYQVDPAGVAEQVKAIYNALKAENITYVNSLPSFGAPEGSFVQRVRLPSESLQMQSANCIDGTVLMCSLLEAASLNPGIVLVPGHAFLAYEIQDRDPKRTVQWDFVETTMIGSHDFDAAQRSARATAAQCQANLAKSKDPADFQILPLVELRAVNGVTPME
jgi:hypothetical protein